MALKANERPCQLSRPGTEKQLIGFDFIVAFAFDRSSFVVRPYEFSRLDSGSAAAPAVVPWHFTCIPTAVRGILSVCCNPLQRVV